MSRAAESIMESKKSDGKHAAHTYDVFISYSHKNKEIVNKFIEILKQLQPSLKIFLDYDQILTGLFQNYCVYWVFGNNA